MQESKNGVQKPKGSSPGGWRDKKVLECESLVCHIKAFGLDPQLQETFLL